MGKVELRLEIDADLLARARAAGVEPQALLEAALRTLAERPRPLGLIASAREKAAEPEGAARRSREWAQDNPGAVDEHNQRVHERGLFAETVPRRW